MKNASYRKINDGSHNSSTYHKKDGTAVRAKLNREARREAYEAQIRKNCDQIERNLREALEAERQSAIAKNFLASHPKIK